MTHLAVGYKLAQRLGIDKYREEFMLGCVAPDAAPIIEPEKKEKVHAHLFEGCGPWGDTQNYEHWLENIKAFWDKYGALEIDEKKKTFVLGVCVHCLTDYWNDLLIWRALQKQYMPPMSLEEFRADYYPENRNVDRWLFQNFDTSDEVMRLLRDSEEIAIGDYFTVGQLQYLKDHLINVQYNILEKVDVSNHKYYPSDKMLWFLEETTARIQEQLKEYK